MFSGMSSVTKANMVFEPQWKSVVLENSEIWLMFMGPIHLQVLVLKNPKDLSVLLGLKSPTPESEYGNFFLAGFNV
jgi:hypothetical protein